MSFVPFNRTKPSDETERDRLSRLGHLARAGVSLQLSVTSGRTELAYSNVSIAVPAALSARCTILQDSPEGQHTDECLSEMYAFWLERAWRRALDSADGLLPIEPKAAEMSHEEVMDEFEMLKAANFLGDAEGVEEQSQRIFRWILESRVAGYLPASKQRHYTDADASPFLRLLGDLPHDLQRRVVSLGPLHILDRLPLCSALAPLVCEVYNEGEICELYVFQDWQSFPDADVWEWRSAAAHHARTTIRIKASFHEWTQYVRGRLPGLRLVQACLQDEDLRRSDLALPPDVTKVRADFDHSLEPKLQWPPALREVHAREFPSENARISMPQLRLPDHLAHLHVEASSICWDKAVFPPGLTLLGLRAPEASDAMPNLAFPCGLRAVHLRCAIGREGLQGLRAVSGLRILNLSWARLEDAEPLRDLARLESLQTLQLNGLRLIKDDAVPDVVLPASLTELHIGASLCGGCSTSGLCLPCGLSSLTLYDLDATRSALQLADLPSSLRSLEMVTTETGSFGASNWLSSAAMPPQLTALSLERVALGTDALDKVKWPASLQQLVVFQTVAEVDAPNAPLFMLRGLPDAMTEIRLTNVKVSLKGATLPTALVDLGLEGCVFQEEEALHDVKWPRTLQRLGLDATNFGSSVHMHAPLPRSITALSLNMTELGRESRNDVLRLPASLRLLSLDWAMFGEAGLGCLALSPCTQLTALSLSHAHSLHMRYDNVALPESLRALVLQCCARRGLDPPESDPPYELPQAPWPKNLRCLALLEPGRKLLKEACDGLRALECLELLVVCSEYERISAAGVQRLLGGESNTKVVVARGEWYLSDLQRLFFQECAFTRFTVSKRRERAHRHFIENFEEEMV